MQTKAPVRQSARSPSRTVAARSPARQPQTPACRRQPAIPRGRRCGDRSLRTRPRPALAQRSKRSERSAPLFGLTLIEMHGMRLRRARNSGRFWLLSVSALLAFACFPVLAQADSSGIQYEEAISTPTGSSPIPSHGGPSAQASDSAPGQAGGKKSGASRKASSGAGSSSTGGNGGTGQGSPPNGSGNGVQPGTQASNSGGSSPLVPILIAIVALAAISIGVVMMKQRRQRHPASQVSPKAS